MDDQQWMLIQEGNWHIAKSDLDGDNNWNETDGNTPGFQQGDRKDGNEMPRTRTMMSVARVIPVLLILLGFAGECQARMFDPQLGRWTRRDPLGYIDGMNSYEYAVSSPQNARDALGLDVGCTPTLAWCRRGDLMYIHGGEDERWNYQKRNGVTTDFRIEYRLELLTRASDTGVTVTAKFSYKHRAFPAFLHGTVTSVNSWTFEGEGNPPNCEIRKTALVQEGRKAIGIDLEFLDGTHRAQGSIWVKNTSMVVPATTRTEMYLLDSNRYDGSGMALGASGGVDLNISVWYNDNWKFVTRDSAETTVPVPSWIWTTNADLNRNVYNCDAGPPPSEFGKPILPGTRAAM